MSLSAHTSITEMNNKCDAVVKQVNSTEFQSIFSEGLKQLQEIFLKNNFELRLCGGAVRDLLLDQVPQDLDFATVATPDQMISMFNSEGIRLINETGWGHGTVTCRICEENFEITTLRIDTVTDGRRAIVKYTTDWRVDASRRDLTVNSMFMTLNGDVIDFFNGMEDLKQREVKFVGNPKQRIMEDYLRILRYFRFFGRISDDECEFDKSTIAVIAQSADGLSHVSGERIQTEMERIFSGNHVVKIVRKMHECGLFPVIGLPEDVDLDAFERVYDTTKSLNPHYMTFVTALLSNEDDLKAYHKRVRFSNVHLNIARFIVKYRSENVSNKDKMLWYVDILVEYHRQYKLKSGANFFMEFLKYRGDAEALDYFSNFKIPVFPVSGHKVKEKTGAKGKDVGLLMNMLFQRWKESKYTATESELLQHINDTTLDEVKSST